MSVCVNITHPNIVSTKIVHSVGSYYICIPQSTIQKTYNKLRYILAMGGHAAGSAVG